MNTSGVSAAALPSTVASRGAVSRLFIHRTTAMVMALLRSWAQLRHRLSAPWGMRVRQVDHITLPCHDLVEAERFYVGILGARILIRIDAAFLVRMGRPQDAVRGEHLSLVFSAGSRVDLFKASVGQPPPLADHPHCAFEVAPSTLLRWKGRLEAAGVKTSGPHRLGPPGQASLYFNDPFGNHLELVTHGFLPEIPMGAPDMATLT